MNNGTYQQLPSGGATAPAAVATPVAIEPEATIAPAKPVVPDVEKTKSTTTTTTIRPVR